MWEYGQISCYAADCALRALKWPREIFLLAADLPTKEFRLVPLLPFTGALYSSPNMIFASITIWDTILSILDLFFAALFKIKNAIRFSNFLLCNFTIPLFTNCARFSVQNFKIESTVREASNSSKGDYVVLIIFDIPSPRIFNSYIIISLASMQIKGMLAH